MCLSRSWPSRDGDLNKVTTPPGDKGRGRHGLPEDVMSKQVLEKEEELARGQGGPQGRKSIPGRGDRRKAPGEK